MDITGIFENENGSYYWMDYLTDDEVERAKYFADEDNTYEYHSCMKSAIYNDMTGYVDVIQNEHRLSDNELYIVTYFKYDKKLNGLLQLVDFGITKQEIIENVKAQKYAEGASYFTMGQMFKTTRDYIEGKMQQ